MLGLRNVLCWLNLYSHVPALYCNKDINPANLFDTRGNTRQKSDKFKYFQIILSKEGINFSVFHILDKPK